MASVTLLDSAAVDSSATSHTTASITPVEGRTYVLAVCSQRSGGVAGHNVSGAGLSWSSVGPASVAQNVNPRRWFEVFAAEATASATPGAITIASAAGAIHSRGWILLELQDVSITGLRNLVRIEEATSVTSLALTFSEAFADAGNVGLAFVLTTIDAAQDQDPNEPDVWAEITNSINGPPGSVWSFAAWFHDGEAPGMTSTWSGTANAAGIAFELSAGPPTPPTFNPAWAARSTITLQPGRAA